MISPGKEAPASARTDAGKVSGRGSEAALIARVRGPQGKGEHARPGMPLMKYLAAVLETKGPFFNKGHRLHLLKSHI